MQHEAVATICSSVSSSSRALEGVRVLLVCGFCCLYKCSIAVSYCILLSVKQRAVVCASYEGIYSFTCCLTIAKAVGVLQRLRDRVSLSSPLLYVNSLTTYPRTVRSCTYTQLLLHVSYTDMPDNCK
jgi:hypothetical protein